MCLEKCVCMHISLHHLMVENRMVFAGLIAFSCVFAVEQGAAGAAHSSRLVAFSRKEREEEEGLLLLCFMSLFAFSSL